MCRSSVAAITLGASFTLLIPRTGQAEPKDHILELRVPKHLGACNDPGWFESRFDLVRGKRRFKELTVVQVAVMADGQNGFVLDIFLRSTGSDQSRMSTRRAYSAPVECTKVVAEAAEITAQMMEAAPPTFEIDHRFELRASEQLAACNDPNQINKWFELSRGNRQFGPGPPKIIGVSFEGDVDTGVTAIVVIQGANGLPILGEDRRPIDDVRYSYKGPTECAKVLAYTAQYITSLIPPQLPPTRYVFVNGNHPKPQTKTLQRDLAAGFAVHGGIVPGWTGAGLQISLKVLPHKNVAILGNFSFINPSIWKSSRGPTEADLPFMAIGSVAICEQANAGGSSFGACAQVNGGGFQVSGSTLADDKEAVVPILSTGTRFYFETPSVGQFSLRADAGFYVNIARIGFQAEGTKISNLSLGSWSLGITARSSF